VTAVIAPDFMIPKDLVRLRVPDPSWSSKTTPKSRLQAGAV